MIKQRKKMLPVLVLIFALAGAGCGGERRGETRSDTEAIKEETEKAEEAEKTEAAEEAEAGGRDGEDAETVRQVASGEETVAPSQVIQEGMEPVYAESLKEGTYDVRVDSSSAMFRVTDCTLTVKDGEMTARMTMSGDGYAELYLGTAEEAARAEDGMIEAETGEDGACRFTVPVAALDMGIDCSAFSRRKEMWYDRVLVFRSDSLPQEAFADGVIATAESLELADGVYTVEVSLEGGSGRASVQSPASMEVREGEAFVRLIWSSSNYDYMRIGEEKYTWSGEGEYSSFTIPVPAFDRKLTVWADTVAMSEPHEIEYTLFFDSETIKEAAQ